MSDRFGVDSLTTAEKTLDSNVAGTEVADLESGAAVGPRDDAPAPFVHGIGAPRANSDAPVSVQSTRIGTSVA